MELRNIITSSTVRFVTATSEQTVFEPDVVSAMKERYRFWECPSKPADFNLDNKGAAFQHGLFGEVVIQKVTLFRNGITVQAERAATDMLDAFVDDLLALGKKTFDFSYEIAKPVERAFNSSLEIGMSEEFGRRYNVIERVGAALDAMLLGYGVSDTAYQFGGLALQPEDVTAKPIRPSRFNIERRANFTLKDNVYFSEAPLRTQEHLELLTTLEELF